MSRQRGVRLGQVPYGRGVFATKAFSSGALVAVVEGEVIDDADYSSDYCVDLGGTLSLEPGAPFRYLNHCCRPNCRLFLVPSDDKDDHPQIILEAVRAIRPGDQITIDYAWPADHAIPCQCESEHCRGWIVDPAELHLIPKAIMP